MRHFLVTQKPFNCFKIQKCKGLYVKWMMFEESQESNNENAQDELRKRKSDPKCI